jgi:hypothetical protein
VDIRADGRPPPSERYLFRPLYRGEVVWNRTRKRDKWGQHRSAARETAQWITRRAPELHVVSDDEWQAAHERLTTVREKYLTATDGRVYGRPRDVESKYLLPGFARCACCGGGLHVRTRDHGRRRMHFYACTSYYNKGKSVCRNNLEARMLDVDAAVLQAIGGQVLAPDIIEDVVSGVLAALAPDNRDEEIQRLGAELAGIRAECDRLVQAIAAGGDMPILLDSLKARQGRQRALQEAIGRRSSRGGGPDLDDLERAVRARLEQWRELLTEQVQAGRGS